MTNTVFNPPIEDRYFEDYIPGSVYEFGSILVKEEDIIDFARRYDPQVFHLDPEGARQSTYGGIIASGWLTAAITMRLLVDHYISRVAGMGSPGSGPIRWLKPVRPGDRLSIRVKILRASHSRIKVDRGVVRAFIETLNQKGEIVMTRTAVGIMACRNKT
ncbi:MAG: Bifunctional protein PaaZ [Syntrophorhabdus sp. PtaU1.Bin153]|nr:MAG: Bifunctional protein PaaZ [Syntrophorhabdus sp. PtaU1.Bin153]